MKRILATILIIVLALSFASCGNKAEKAASAGNRQAQGNETGETDDLQVEYGKIKESDLSDKYRIDLVPIFKGSVIMSTIEDPDHKMVGLGCYSKKPYKEIKEYYKEIMSKYEIKNEQENTDPYFDEPPSYYIEAQLGEKVYAAVNVIDASKAPDDYFEGGEFEVPKDAKTVFSLIFTNFEE
ncbi:MAG: hypothetical protein ACM3XR_11310 [Bacillota bacterium]